jgi:tripartite-type tricarboxylate transporter receptor subunit TctC
MNSLHCVWSIAGFSLAMSVSAAEYPTRPIRLIVPFPPGGTTDILARLIGPKLTETLKQPVVIDNRSGASGIIGADAVAKAPGDGHTLGIIISTHAISPALLAKSPFDPARDFAPITLAISVANVISVHPSVQAKSLAELIAMAKAQPGKLSFGSAGTGTGVHLTGELFKSVARLDITHVPYKRGGPALADLIAGQIPMGVQNISTIVPHVRAGRIRPARHHQPGTLAGIARLADGRVLRIRGIRGEGVVRLRDAGRNTARDRDAAQSGAGAHHQSPGHPQPFARPWERTSSPTAPINSARS